jgi:DNA repair exonuclease SbcCD ATPase subunit
MTIEERFERIEHVTAGLAEERRKDREEYRQWWRDSQRQISELGDKIERLAEESRAANKRLEGKIEHLGEKIERLAEESRAADKRLEERIESLVSAIGRALTK